MLIQKVKNDDYNTKEIEISEKEKEGIRKHYMGLEKKQRKVRKMNDKKFVFDWAASEDTSSIDNPLYTKKAHLHLLGRGKIAGIDLLEQKKKLSQESGFYQDLIKNRRTEGENERQMYIYNHALIFLEHWKASPWPRKPRNPMTKGIGVINQFKP
jgi:ATP-dependent RNA helicase DDX23/PRP28